MDMKPSKYQKRLFTKFTHLFKGGILKNLSIKWSFMLYVVLYMTVFATAGVGLSTLFNDSQNSIYSYYENEYRNEIGKRGDLVVDGEILKGEGVWIYTENLTSKFSKKDLYLYKLYGILSMFSAPVLIIAGVIVCGIMFYIRKLKKPLTLLNTASSRIASSDLSFSIAYDSKNELGNLVSSFETMRKSLYQTNKEMWHMIEEHKCLNAAFAHDLRTPLTVLKGYCDFLQKYLKSGELSTEKTIEKLSMMDIYIKRLEGYTDAMTSLQKLEEIQINPQTVLSDNFCNELKSMAQQLAKDKSLSFKPSCSANISIDSSAVFQVCENLISNAVRYAVSKIEITCALSENFLTISISDDGEGFSEEALKNASKPYFRDKKEASDSSHFGIGLYICKLLCEKHGGELKLTNNVGIGAMCSASFAIKNNFSV